MDKIPVKVEFLFTELAAGLTFARIALDSSRNNAKKSARNRENARKAYDSLLHFQGRVPLSPEDKAKYEEGKKELRASLKRLGEEV